MKKYHNRQDEALAQITALYGICRKHEDIIARDAIVQQDMDQLMGFLRISSSESSNHCEKIIRHLNKEIKALVAGQHLAFTSFMDSMNTFNKCFVVHSGGCLNAMNTGRHNGQL